MWRCSQAVRGLILGLTVSVLFAPQVTAIHAEEVTKKVEETTKRKRGKSATKNPLSASLKALLGPAETKPDKKEIPASSHEQIKLIKLKTPQGTNVQMHALALDSKGRLLAACGGTRITREATEEGAEIVTEIQPGEIRVYSPEGNLVTTWSLEVAPQAMFVAGDGTVYVAGYEKIMKLSADGKQLAVADLPHGKLIDESKELIRKDTIKQIKDQKKRMQKYVDLQQKKIDSIKEKPEDERTKSDKSRLKQAEMMIKIYQRYLKDDDETINQRVLSTINRKKTVASLAVTNEDVFVATYDVTGYGFCIWRLSHSLDQPKKIVTNLRGCCGNMHIGAGNGELFVAENARHRVCRYDREGELIKTFGKKDRDGLDGFSSCCNPMNVCITSKGEVYTSESNVGRIKRYTSDGEYLELIGTVDLVPGCKNVSIVVTPDHKRVYMMDKTRSHVIVMQQKSNET